MGNYKINKTKGEISITMAVWIRSFFVLNKKIFIFEALYPLWGDSSVIVNSNFYCYSINIKKQKLCYLLVIMI